MFKHLLTSSPDKNIHVPATEKEMNDALERLHHMIAYLSNLISIPMDVDDSDPFDFNHYLNGFGNESNTFKGCTLKEWKALPYHRGMRITLRTLSFYQKAYEKSSKHVGEHIQKEEAIVNDLPQGKQRYAKAWLRGLKMVYKQANVCINHEIPALKSIAENVVKITS